MIEITLDFARAQLAACTADVPDSLKDIYDALTLNQRDVMRYMTDYFINRLKFINVRDFVNDIFEKGVKLNVRDYQHLATKLRKTDHVIDVGSGWGGLCRILCDNIDNVHAVDHVLEHAVATKIQCPEARVYQSDARDMPLLTDSCMDVAIAHGVIEHVGYPGVPTGASGPNMAEQYKLVREMSRILKDEGLAFYSTGNYLFPYDEEVNLWFYHWLPTEEKQDYNQKNKRSVDRYWLLNWDELRYLLGSCDLLVEEVSSSDTDTWDGMFLDALGNAFSNLDADMAQRWTRLVKTDPHFFSSWLVFARKKAAPSALDAVNPACYAVRALGTTCTGDLKQTLVIVKEQEETIKALVKQIQALHNSRSWKVTRPLRWAGELARRKGRDK